MLKSFVDAMDMFVEVSDWLGPEDEPAVVSLYHMAAQLDDELTGPILNAFGLTYRNLLKRQPRPEPEVVEDPLAKLLKR